jgi:hypothetical protein
MDCWQQISQFQQFLQCMLSQMGPVPLQGVTDGSNAKPGYIGEFITGVGSIAYAANPAVTTAVTSPLVVAPGDWDLWAFLLPSTEVGAMSFSLSPLPVGVSNPMQAASATFTPGVGASESVILNATPARGNFTVPTLLAFSVSVWQSTDASLPAGTATLTVSGRRRR